MRASRRRAAYTLQELSGTPIELVCGAGEAEAPFASAHIASGFVTGDEGVGYMVIGAADRAATAGFYQELLGMRLSTKFIRR